jgi:hypothetical protein
LIIKIRVAPGELVSKKVRCDLGYGQANGMLSSVDTGASSVARKAVRYLSSSVATGGTLDVSNPRAGSPVVCSRVISYLISMCPLNMFDMFDSRLPGERLRLASLIFLYVVICSVSSVFVARFFFGYHFLFHAEDLPGAMIAAAAFAPVFLLFVFAEFSFGYFIGFYFASMVLGYLWVSQFSDYGYDRGIARLSAAASAVAFLLPALFVSSPIRRRVTMSELAFDRLLMLILLLSLAILLVAATYNFRFVAPAAASNTRADWFPPVLRYLLGITSSAVLPFLFACHAERKRYWSAGAVLLLLLLYYPVTVSKTALFAPVWLVFLAVLLRLFGTRFVVVLSLVVPTLVGLVVALMQQSDVTLPSSYFNIVNFRMIAIPSIAMDVYNEFFSRHKPTLFCQIGIMRYLVDCPYHEPLSIVMRNNFPFGGNFNASLFATEGIASVGPRFAPIPVLAGGLVVALGNRVSAGLPPSVVLVSSAILCQILLNVPLSTSLLSYGGGVLFLLWSVTPRTMFLPERQGKH